MQLLQIHTAPVSCQPEVQAPTGPCAGLHLSSYTSLWDVEALGGQARLTFPRPAVNFLSGFLLLPRRVLGCPTSTAQSPALALVLAELL